MTTYYKLSFNFTSFIQIYLKYYIINDTYLKNMMTN